MGSVHRIDNAAFARWNLEQRREVKIHPGKFASGDAIAERMIRKHSPAGPTAVPAVTPSVEAGFRSSQPEPRSLVGRDFADQKIRNAEPPILAELLCMLLGAAVALTIGSAVIWLVMHHTGIGIGVLCVLAAAWYCGAVRAAGRADEKAGRK